jgi:hypothetical protein
LRSNILFPQINVRHPNLAGDLLSAELEFWTLNADFVGDIAEMGEAVEKAGGKTLMMCGTNWSSDQWSFAGMEEFPNIEAVQNYMAAADELNLFRYVEATSVLGTKMEP